ncbi:MAG TPA: hypothetical protein VFG50_08425 [Rhodothermales bacterium]|nr:hypothetical protein [Rhodothermales bacterium]
MLIRIACISLILAAFTLPAQAQHTHQHQTERDSTRAMSHPMHMDTSATMPHEMGGTAERGDVGAITGSMPGMLLPGVPMTREASGTSWQPDATLLEAVHTQAAGWNLMLHGNVYLRATSQDVFGAGDRGGRQFDAPNWFMGMASRSVGGGLFGARAMLSLDPITVGGNGYPLLFQTGETFEGEPLIDRQHPHDLFSELAVSYGQEIGEKAGVFAYFGLPGEPALGPTAFMHRASAAHLSDSPLGHHWQDATHIDFGVATLGARYGDVKLDGSIFTGREPDENRYGFDTPRFDSYSLRLTANPTDRLSLQVSRGFLKSPEALEPEADQWRTTVSITYNAPFRTRGAWSNTLVWGLNQPAKHSSGHTSDLLSLLAESDLDFGRSAVYTRLEWVQKDAHELGIETHPPYTSLLHAPGSGAVLRTTPVQPPQDPPGEAPIYANLFNIGAWTLGFARDVDTFGNFKVMVGLQASVYRVPPDLRGTYGDFPVSGQVYLRFSPTRMLMGRGGMQDHSGHAMPGM